MQNKITFLTACVSLIITITALAEPPPAPTPTSFPATVTSLPYYITVPGKYVLAKNLSFSGIGLGIMISLTGGTSPVTVDFRGFTITGSFPSVNDCNGVYIQANEEGPVPPYPIIIENGTIALFENGVANAGNGTYGPQVTIRNMVFSQNGTGVLLGNTYGATVSNCQFIGLLPFTNTIPDNGIYDSQDYGNNTFNNNTFLHIYAPLTVTISPPSVPAYAPPRNPKYIVTNSELFPSGVK